MIYLDTLRRHIAEGTAVRGSFGPGRPADLLLAGLDDVYTGPVRGGVASA